MLSAKVWEGRWSTAGWPLSEGVEREAHDWKGKVGERGGPGRREEVNVFWKPTRQ